MSMPASYGTFSSFRKPPRDCHMSRVSRDDACMHFDPRKILAENLYRVIFVRDQSNPHAWTGGNAAVKKAVQRAPEFFCVARDIYVLTAGTQLSHTHPIAPTHPASAGRGLEDTMARIEIRHRSTGAVLYAGDGESVLEVVAAAVQGGADLRGANLGGANLRGADLGGADLRGADLGGADLARANLRGADLRGANLYAANLYAADLYVADLRWADLGEAKLGGAKLGGANLVGSRPVMQIGPIGSRADYLVAVVTTDGVRVTAGCFSGTLDEFRAAVESTHGDSKHGRDYRAAIAMIEAHAEIWAHAAAEVA